MLSLAARLAHKSVNVSQLAVDHEQDVRTVAHIPHLLILFAFAAQPQIDNESHNLLIAKTHRSDSRTSQATHIVDALLLFALATPANQLCKA